MGRKSGLDFVEAFCKEGLYVNEIHLHTNDVIGMHKMKQRIKKGKEEGEINPNLVVKYVGAKNSKVKLWSFNVSYALVEE